jgi:hypothetical protein
MGGREGSHATEEVMKRIAIALVALGCFGTLSAQETTTPRREAQVERRANRQQKRIAQGTASGQLTPKETQHLEKREAKLDQNIAKAEADGKVTKQEQRKINQQENSISRDIKRKKHNARKVQ